MGELSGTVQPTTTRGFDTYVSHVSHVGYERPTGRLRFNMGVLQQEWMITNVSSRRYEWRCVPNVYEHDGSLGR